MKEYLEIRIGLSPHKKVVYTGMCCDFLHAGHMNIIEQSRKYGRLIVGLLTDEAISSYKRVPVQPYEQRKRL